MNNLRDIFLMQSESEYRAFKEFATKVTGTEALSLTEKVRKDFTCQFVCGHGSMEFQPLSNTEALNESQEKGVAVLTYSGVMNYESYWWGIGTKDIDNILNSFGSNKNVQSVLFEISTNGGSPNGLETLSNTIKTFEQTYGKELVVLVTNGCYSAGVWTVCGAKKIYLADKITGIGSIGIQSIFVDDSKYLEKEGIKIITLRALQSVNKNIEVDNAEKGDFTMIIDSMTQTNDVFIDRVKESRGDKLDLTSTKAENNPDNIPDIFTGLVYKGENAMKMGLADGIKSKRQILKDMVTEANIAIEIGNTVIIDNAQAQKEEENMNGTEILEKLTALVMGTKPDAAKVEAEVVADVTTVVEAAAQNPVVDFSALISKAVSDAASAVEAKFAPQIEASSKAVEAANKAVEKANAANEALKFENERLIQNAQLVATTATASPNGGGVPVLVTENTAQAFDQNIIEIQSKIGQKA